MTFQAESVKHAVDQDGKYLGAFDGGELPLGAIQVATWPEDARQVLKGSVWAWPDDVLVERAAREALSRKSEMLLLAVAAIEPLQDSVDIGEATPSEEAELLAWKRHRVQLNQLEQQQGYPLSIHWPVPPTSTAA